MNLFETSGADYINLDRVARFERDTGQIVLHFEGENEITLRNHDAQKLNQVLAQLAAEFERRLAGG